MEKIDEAASPPAVSASERLKLKSSSLFHPTEAELKVLEILWELNEGSVKAVHERIRETRDVGYTTTLKIMQIMLEKGLVIRQPSGNHHIYSPSVSREKIVKQQVSKMLNLSFNGSAFELVSYVLEHKKIGKKEAEILKKKIKGLL